MRGGTHCVGSTVPPIVKLNPAGKQLLTFGAGLFVMPHGLYVDNDNNVWVTDADGKDGKGPSARPVSGAADPIPSIDPPMSSLRRTATSSRKGSAHGEFDTPHALAIDSKGRLLVGDRGNSRVQIFDQDGRFLEELRQFGRPSGIFVDRNDVFGVETNTQNLRKYALERGTAAQRQ